MSDINETEFRKADLNLLVVFEVLMRHHSVTRAAKDLSLSQAAVSAALGRLRRLFDDPLFLRTSDGMRPTARAQDIHQHIAPALTVMREAVLGPADFDPRRANVTFTLGMSDDIEAHLMPRLVQEAQESYPGLKIIARPAHRLVVAQLLADGAIDAGIAPAADLRVHQRRAPLFASGYQCIYDGVRLGLPTPLTLQDFVACPHVVVSHDGRSGTVEDILVAQGLERTVLTSTTHFAAVVAMLKSVRAIATIPQHAARAYALHAGLTLSPPPITMPDFQVFLIWSHSRSREPAHVWLRNWITATAKRWSVTGEPAPQTR